MKKKKYTDSYTFLNISYFCPLFLLLILNFNRFYIPWVNFTKEKLLCDFNQNHKI
jgi:hypothetical protein